MYRKRSIKFFNLLLGLLLLGVMFSPVLGVKQVNSASLKASITGKLKGTASNASFETGPSNTPESFVGRIIQSLLGFIGVIALVLVVYSGIMWMTAGGKTEQIDKARKTLVAAVGGLVVVSMAYAITAFIISSIAG